MKQIAALLVACVALTGCASIDAVQSVAGVYSSARNVTSGYHAYSSIKDLKSASPHFQGYNSVLVLADIRPREDAAELPAAFAGNMAVYTSSLARTVRAPLQVCQVMNQCSGKVLVLNFKEDAYDRNIVQRLTVGDKIRGKLLFTDSSTGQIIDEKRVEMGENYGSLAQLTSGMIMTTMLKSFPWTTEAEGERIGKEVEKTPVVAPQYERILGKAS